jgi:hypothetical protein
MQKTRAELDLADLLAEQKNGWSMAGDAERIRQLQAQIQQEKTADWPNSTKIAA